jgi:hypothetical protein
VDGLLVGVLVQFAPYGGRKSVAKQWQNSVHNRTIKNKNNGTWPHLVQSQSGQNMTVSTPLSGQPNIKVDS